MRKVIPTEGKLHTVLSSKWMEKRRVWYRPELIIHLNLPIIQIFYSQICSLLFNNMSLLFKNNRDRTAFSSSRSRKASGFVREMAARKKVFKILSLYTH